MYNIADENDWNEHFLVHSSDCFRYRCFPVNPPVLSGLLETSHCQITYIIGWPVWAFGMLLVISPIIVFPGRGGVEKGKSFVHTSRRVDTGIYSVVRHPQYVGGIFALFITTILWYPYWLFGVLGIAGTVTVYMGCREEDKMLLRKFGDDYREYMERVPGLNLFAGFIRLIRQKRTR